MKLETHFLKSSDFKTIYGSGVFGGITPQGLININFFTERAPLPKRIVLEIDEKTGSLLGEVERESKEGLIREVNCGILMDINAAKQLLNWLQEKIDQHEDLKATLSSDNN